MCGSMMHDGAMAAAGLWWAALLAVLLGAAALAITALAYRRRALPVPAAAPVEAEDPALRTLKKRYARGEIDDEEFQARLGVLLARSGR